MAKQMSRRVKFGIVAAIIVVVAIITFFGALMLVQTHLAYLERHVAPHAVPGDIEYFYVANALFNTINIALLLVLITVYASLYLKTRSPFTIGLLIFAVAFLVRDLTSSPFVTSIYGFRAYGLGPFAFLPSVIEMAALSVLVYLSVKY